ncbi:hypothetical protein OG689_15710 [Kitasatospora sp. NBC_00240]|uniref:hypothetical protein n=1 Tax=Kitasatospora sp. NBC_00240 TaxID=2903567 RepID=UPI00225B1C0F|nr:hypothetical protein [Kitasatospora sp. NBC_00240]MCX5210716.1 hypothetical protein [Kitasatospora sp. NBC_00240]
MSATTPGKDDPLPVKSKAEAQAWAQQITQHMADSAGLRTDPSTANPFFNHCTGKNGESAPDDRYYLMYSIFSAVPLAQHPEVIRKIRDMLQKEGLSIKGYREAIDDKPDALVDASHPTSRYFVTASTGGRENTILLQIITPCLMPPTEAS